MQDLPHFYVVKADAEGASNVSLSSKGIPELESAGPAEFGGPGDVWSPETLLVAAVADCFVLSFRAIARKAKLDWTTLTAEATGKLDKLDGFTQFVEFTIKAELTIPDEQQRSKAEVILEKGEKYCLVSNSMKAVPHLETTVLVDKA
jgi:organic hydroperoxide reductase OsmC/OhrA